MPNEPVAEDGVQRSFLAADESAELTWAGTLKEGDEEYGAEFVATDNRLVFSLGHGHFKDIGFQHVESVEVATDIETHRSGTDPDSMKIVGAILAITGAIILYLFGSGGLALIGGLGLIGFGGYTYWHAVENYDELAETVEVTQQEVYHIMLRTSATSPFSLPIYIETTANIGPDLSRLVQEAK